MVELEGWGRRNFGEGPTLRLTPAIQRHVAIFAVGPSTVRGQGAKGVVAAAQEFLSEVPLRPFATSAESSFRNALDSATENLALAFPKAARRWGLARKCVNVFLRDAFYNSHLCPLYHLERAKPFYEIPLDGVVARALLRLGGPNRLPVWPGVKHLQPVTSGVYQAFAKELSRRWKIDRVYLDTYIWVENRER